MQIERFAHLKPTDTLYFDEEDQLQIASLASRMLPLRLPCLNSSRKAQTSLPEIAKYFDAHISAESDLGALLAIRRYFVARNSASVPVQHLVQQIDSLFQSTNPFFCLPHDMIRYISLVDIPTFNAMRGMSRALHKALPLSVLKESKLMQNACSGHLRSIGYVLRLIIGAPPDSGRDLLKKFFNFSSSAAKSGFFRLSFAHNALKTLAPLFEKLPQLVTSLEVLGRYDAKFVANLIAKLSDLTELKLNGTSFPSTKLKPDDLALLPDEYQDINSKLVSLDITQGDFSNLCYVLNHLARLKTLKLRQLTEEFHKVSAEMHLAPPSSLEVLHLCAKSSQENFLPSSVPWEALTRLHTLHLCNCTVFGTLVERFKRLPLTSLSVVNNLAEDAMDKIFELKRLVSLSLETHGLPLSAITAGLHRLPTLRKLSLCGRHAIEQHFQPTVTEILRKRPDLTELKLHFHTAVSQNDQETAALIALLQKNKTLESLSFYNGRLLSVDLWKAILLLPSLKKLHIVFRIDASFGEALIELLTAPPPVPAPEATVAPAAQVAPVASAAPTVAPVAQVAPAAPVCHIEDLSVYLFNVDNSTEVIGLFSEMKSLRTLELHAPLCDRSAALLAGATQLETLKLVIGSESSLSNKGLDLLSSMPHLKRLIIVGKSRIRLDFALTVLRQKTHLHQFACTRSVTHSRQVLKRNVFQDLFGSWLGLGPDYATDPLELDLLRNSDLPETTEVL